MRTNSLPIKQPNGHCLADVLGAAQRSVRFGIEKLCEVTLLMNQADGGSGGSGGYQFSIAQDCMGELVEVKLRR